MIHLGPAGNSGLGYEKGLKQCNDLKLDALEVEFTYGVKMTDAQAKMVGIWANANNVALSIHAPYYINLVSKEKEKITASKKRIIDSCSRGDFFYNKKFERFVPIVFHAGFYQDLEKDYVYEMKTCNE